MKRKHIYALMLTLLTLLPAGLLAQSLTGMQYWFDNGSKHTISISEGENTENLSTSGLSVGMHTLYYRFTQSGGDIYEDFETTDPETGEVTKTTRYYADLDYSPVYSVRFFKHDPSQGGTVEYWFDKMGNSNHVKKDISGQEDETVTLDLTDINKFPLGFHQLNMRFSTPGKSPSAIYTADVMKFSAGSDYLEYWVDDNQQNSQKLKTGAGNASVVVTTAMPLDLSHVSPGLHHLYFRTCDANGVAGSAVYSAIIFRHAEEASQIEYWFDDDASTIQKKQFAEAYQNGAGYTLELSNDIFPQGLHQLNIRVSTKNSGKSAIYSMPVIKMAANSFNTVEFWLDDDRENVQTLSGSLSSNGVAIVGDLDFSYADPGMHYLHYRAIGKDGKPSNAIGEWPVMVKSRYPLDPEEVKVTGYSFWVDNQEPIEYYIPEPTRNKTIHHQIDARKLSQGNHTLHTKVWNSYGVRLTEQDVFTVGKVDVPQLTLTATAEDGCVQLTTNALANDVSYMMYRKNADGASAKVYTASKSYPTDVAYADHPATGSYTYYAVGVYTDADGKEQQVSSNEVPVSVTASETPIATNVGNVIGRLAVDSHTPESGVTVRFSDGVSVSVNDGMFRRNNVPCAKMTLTVDGDDAHQYEPKEIEVKEGQNLVELEGQLVEDLIEDNRTNDLAFDSKISYEPGRYIKFTLRRLTSKKWEGSVRVRFIKKRDKTDDDDTPPDNDDSSILESEKNYEVIQVDNLSISWREEITIPLDEFRPKKKEWYYIYVESQRKSENATQKPKFKLVANDLIYDAKNPILKKIDKVNTEQLEDEDKVILFSNLVVGACGFAKTLDTSLKYIADFGTDVLAKAFDNKLQGVYTKEQLTSRIERLVEGGQVEPDDKKVSKLISEVIGESASINNVLIRDFRDKIKDGVKVASNIKKYWGYVDKSLKTLDDIQDQTSYENYFYCAQKLLGLSSDPFTKVLKVYLDVGEKIVNKALGIFEDWYKTDVVYDFLDFRPDPEQIENNPKLYAYNKKLNFKIRIKHKRTFPHLLDTSVGFKYVEPSRLIDKVLVKMNNMEDQNLVATATFDMIGEDDCIMLKQTSIDNRGVSAEQTRMGGNGYLSGGNEVRRFWMEIYWKNGRISYIPLLDTDGVKLDLVEYPNLITVTFYSESADGPVPNIADIIRLDD